jgi:hypothetical protein
MLCVDGAHNQPDCQRNRNSKNYQDDESDAGFHDFISTGDTTWLRAVCAALPAYGKPQKPHALKLKFS